ncbi:hypothetical protein HPT25_23400 [Bacillus sp. BRMEA1]|uniref:hypothetical protein n=1 Tax=Neobacillus endophyticus TaxID=2738405 RepID=UPI00156465A3|nr:hypothetical protein [Neobacillus endophyticus]NRD80272.1 hypothetical protein [Neobacillus endophyticus]
MPSFSNYTINSVNPDGNINVAPVGKIQDLGIVISATNMAAGATVYSSLITGTPWVRNLLMLTQSDQQYDIGVSRVDTSGIQDWTTWVSTNNGSTASSWRPVQVVGASALLGVSAKLAIKNSSASANTFANVRAQLIGL